MKKLYNWLIYCVSILAVIGQVQAQTIVNQPRSIKNSKLQLGLAEVVEVKQNNSNAVLSESNVPLYGLQNYKDNNSKIRVDIISKGNGDALYTELVNLEIEIIGRQQNFFTCWAEIAQISNYLNKAPSILFMRSSLKPMNNAGPIQSQGDAAQRSDLARALGVNGAGVKVGVLSDSYNNLGGAATGVSTGELPGSGNPSGFVTPVTVMSDMTGGGTDEGRAMIEIIHDVAPGAQLYYYSAFNGEADFAAGIKALADAGCKVIVDDVFYLTEPMFQDGIIAQAVDYAVNEKGATYFSAAGNSANQSYDANYQASTFEPFGAGQGTAHNFGTMANPVYYLPTSITNPGTVNVILQWDEPAVSAGNGSPGSASDLNLVLMSYDGTSYNPVAGSENANLNKDPVEVATYAGSGTFYVVVTKVAGPDPTRLRITNIGKINWNATPANIIGIKAGTNAGHPNAAGAIATAAAYYADTPAFGTNPPKVEPFSSKGGVKIMFTKAGVKLTTPEDRFKPEITAPDGANTSFFGADSEPDGSPNFFGTSAAVPHAAAVAALLLEADPLLTPAAVKTKLINSCTDMDDPTTVGFDVGFDYSTGAGLIKADVAVQAALCSIAPSNVSVNLSTICSGSSIVLKATCASGVISWYDSESGGEALGAGNGFIQSPTSNTTYYAACNNETCESIRVATGLVTVVPVALNLTNDLSGNNVVLNATQTITATNKIIPSAKINYTAGNNILLIEGFEAKIGSIFSAQIEGCIDVPIYGMVAYYPFNGNANDETGNGNNGVVNGPVLATDRFGNTGKAYAFDGVDDFITVTQNAHLNAITKTTISFWANHNQVNRTTDGFDWQAYFSKDTFGKWFTSMLCTDPAGCQGEQPLIFYHPGLNVPDSRYNWSTVSPNLWYHITVSNDGAVSKFYINGELKHSVNVSGSVTTNTHDLILGRCLTGSLYPLDGRLDDLRIYDRALTDTEVLTLYDAEKP